MPPALNPSPRRSETHLGRRLTLNHLSSISHSAPAAVGCHFPPAAYYSHPRAELLPFIPPGVQTVLDLGCGEGAFGQLLQRQRGCRVTGVEPCPAAFAVAAARLHNAHLDSAEAFLAACAGRFDLICFNDLLEHLVDPWTQLRACHRLLDPTGGFVLASVPNIRFYFALKELILRADFPYQAAGTFDRTHLRFFTRKSLRRLFAESGYAVICCQGINQLRSRRFTWPNRLLFGLLDELLSPQFAVLASPVSRRSELQPHADSFRASEADADRGATERSGDGRESPIAEPT